jgi:hypothetical protein
VAAPHTVATPPPRRRGSSLGRQSAAPGAARKGASLTPRTPPIHTHLTPRGDGSTLDRQSAAVDAHYGASTTLAYYKDVHGRNGVDGRGTMMRSRVHLSKGYDNAYCARAAPRALGAGAVGWRHAGIPRRASPPVQLPTCRSSSTHAPQRSLPKP